MDFPADITLRKTRMKFELTFKVVLLFSYQGLLPCESFYILSHRLLFVKNFFKFFQLLFLNPSCFPLLSFSEEVVLLCRATFISYHTCFILSRTFFIYLKIFFPISFKSMCSHVQRILSYHNNIITSSFFLYFFFFAKKRRILYLFYNGARITS